MKNKEKPELLKEALNCIDRVGKFTKSEIPLGKICIKIRFEFRG